MYKPVHILDLKVSNSFLNISRGNDYFLVVVSMTNCWLVWWIPDKHGCASDTTRSPLSHSGFCSLCRPSNIRTGLPLQCPCRPLQFVRSLQYCPPPPQYVAYNPSASTDMLAGQHTTRQAMISRVCLFRMQPLHLCQYMCIVAHIICMSLWVAGRRNGM